MCRLIIEKNVPPPEKIPKIPFKDMEKGDSVVIKLKEKSDLNTIRQRVYRENQKEYGRFSCYQIGGNEDGNQVRIYRWT
jgi:hypothetical protein